MKFFASAFLAFAASSAAWLVVKGDYACFIEFYTNNAAHEFPPSVDAKFGKTIIESFNEAYADENDVHMVYEYPIRDGDTVTTANGMDQDHRIPTYAPTVANGGMLRGQVPTPGNRDLQSLRCKGPYCAEGNWGCNYCPDDDARFEDFAGVSGEEFGETLSKSEHHKKWEELFCEKFPAAVEGYDDMKTCKFVLSQCHKEASKDTDADIDHHPEDEKKVGKDDNEEDTVTVASATAVTETAEITSK